MFFIQMSGFPGSGKSTLAREISKRTGSVIIDHDIVKSALLTSLNSTSINPKAAGGIAYDIDWALIDFHLASGHNVILDSPCLYEEMILKGTELTRKHQVEYKYIECILHDFNEINDRLKKRERKISQIEEIQSEEAFRKTIESSKKPDVPVLMVDTSKPIEEYIDEVMDYLNITYNLLNSVCFGSCRVFVFSNLSTHLVDNDGKIEYKYF